MRKPRPHLQKVQRKLKQNAVLDRQKCSSSRMLLGFPWHLLNGLNAIGIHPLTRQSRCLWTVCSRGFPLLCSAPPRPSTSLPSGFKALFWAELPELIFRSAQGANCRLLRCLRTLEPRPGVSSATVEGRITRSGFNQFGPYGSYLEILACAMEREGSAHWSWPNRLHSDELTKSLTRSALKQINPSAVKNQEVKQTQYFQKHKSSL